MPNVDRKVSLIYENRTFSGTISTIQQKLRANFGRGDLHGTVAFLLRAVPYGGIEYQRLDAIFYRIHENDQEQLNRGMFLPGRHEFHIQSEIEEMIHRLPFFLERVTNLDNGFIPGKPFNPLAAPKLPIWRILLLAGSLLFLYMYFFVPPTEKEPQAEPTQETIPTQELLRRIPANSEGNRIGETAPAFFETHPHYLQFASLPSLWEAHTEWERLEGRKHGLEILHALVNPDELGEKRYMYRVVKLGFASEAAAQVARTSRTWKQQPLLNTIRPIPNCGSSVCIQEHFQRVQEAGISYYQHLE